MRARVWLLPVTRRALGTRRTDGERAPATRVRDRRCVRASEGDGGGGGGCPGGGGRCPGNHSPAAAQSSPPPPPSTRASP